MPQSHQPHGVTSTAVRVVAMAAMVVDHVAGGLVDWWLRDAGSVSQRLALETASTALHVVGRLAFPLFAFLLVEGFFHTRSRGRYLARLLGLAVASELPFDLALYLWPSEVRAGTLWDLGHQNVLLTLAVALASIWAMEVVGWGRDGAGAVRPGPRRLALVALAAALGCSLGWLLRVDYSWCGVLSVEVGYLVRRRNVGTSRGPAATMLAMVLPLCLFSAYELLALADVAVVAGYDGRQGRELPRWLSYGFYPAHLLALAALRLAPALLA